MYKKNFKKRITGLVLGFFCALQLTAQTVPASQYWPEEISINSPHAIVMEMNTGTILYDKNSKEARYPASITKIMTTMLALENSESLDKSNCIILPKESGFESMEIT